MQYGVELFPYKRAQRLKSSISESKKTSDELILNLMLYLISPFLITRVMLINNMAPFGIAFILAAIPEEKKKIPYLSACGALLGYLSIYRSGIDNIGAYFLIISTILLINYFMNDMSKKNQILLYGIIIFIEFLLYDIFLGNSLIQSIFSSGLEIVCVFSAYYIFSYSITSIKEIKLRKLFIKEESICLIITVSLLIAGIGQVIYKGISLRNITALLFLLVISFMKGSEEGAAFGIILGIVLGMTPYGNMINLIAFYGLCGLITGTFKDAGKLWSGAAFIMAVVLFNLYSLYSGIQMKFDILEILFSLIIFMIISPKMYRRLEIIFDLGSRQKYLKEDYNVKLNNIILKRITNFSEALKVIPYALNKLSNNDKAEINDNNLHIIQNLTDKVCSMCTQNCKCWKNESYYTFSAFTELIENYQRGIRKIPYEIEKKCIKQNTLFSSMQQIMNSYAHIESYKHKTEEFNKIYGKHIRSIAECTQKILSRSDNVKFNSMMEDKIERELRKSHIPFKEVICYENEWDRLTIKIGVNECGRNQICIKNLLPVINKVTGKLMCVSGDHCNVDESSKICEVVFDETPTFYVATYLEKICKTGEQYSGDNCCYGKINESNYMVILSDGMGSGPQASEESSTAVQMMKKFSQAGFSDLDAVNTINSVFSLEFSEEENFCTIDINNIDLYTGKCSFIKVGSADSFIKKGNDVDIINSNTLPVGVMDDIDIETIERTLKDGDMIIMVSDGVLDYSSEVLGKTDWIVKFLKNTTCTDPKELSVKLMQRVLELSGGKAKDDMSIAVSKVYSIC